MFNYEMLPFLRGWTYATKSYKFPSVGKNQPVTTEQIFGPGWVNSILVYASDSRMMITLAIDQVQLNSTINEAQMFYRYPNNSFVYVGQYSPASGTSGNFTMLFNPSQPFPFNGTAYVSFQLLPSSTQNTAYAEVSAFVTQVIHKAEFLESIAEFNQKTSPEAYPETGTRTQFNPFASIRPAQGG